MVDGSLPRDDLSRAKMATASMPLAPRVLRPHASHVRGRPRESV